MTAALTLPNAARAEDNKQKKAHAQAQAQRHVAKQNASAARVRNQNRAARNFNNQAVRRHHGVAAHQVRPPQVNRQVTTAQPNTAATNNASRTWRNRGNTGTHRNTSNDWRTNTANTNVAKERAQRRVWSGNSRRNANWNRTRHDRHWYTSRYNRFARFGNGYYYWDAGFWYPAYGYDPYFSTYIYDAPIYGYNNYDPGQVIANVQAELQRSGYYRGALDGLFGPQTRAALLAFQSDQGMRVTGEIDEATLYALGLT
jgi:hypothetical protein